jgi:hypothetical protein
VLSGLPRFGLRALAGHLGHELGEARRAADHVCATARIWQELCRMLTERGVDDVPALLELLAEPPTRRAGSERIFPLPAERRQNLPDRPGVYRFLDPNGRVLYVGKAANLRQRVASYFQPRGYRLNTTLEMLTQAFDVQETETETRLEAALLEVDEIRRLDPPYNTALRDRGNRPATSAELFDELTAMIDSPDAFLDGKVESPAIGLTYPEPPDIEALSRGIELFREVFLKGREPTAPSLAALGSVLWWERTSSDSPPAAGDEPPPNIEKANPARDGADQNSRRNGVHPRPKAGVEEQDVEESFEWTPARVARSLARGARHAAHLQRREIWHRLLRSCTITWRGRDEDSEPVLAIENGSDGNRLRVLTTELRRVAADGRLLEIRLAPDVALSSERVRSLLEWI